MAHHLSRPLVAKGLDLPTLAVEDRRADGRSRVNRDRGNAWYFNPRGLPTARITTNRRALLPHVFTLTLIPQFYGTGRFVFCGTFRIPQNCGTPAVSRRGALRCPDFPLAVLEASKRWTKQ